MRTAILSIFVGLAAVIPAPAQAQSVVVVPNPEASYARRHFYLGAEGVGVAVLGQSGPREFLSHGGGVNLFLGGRVSRRAAIEFGWQPTFHGRDGAPLAAGDNGGLGFSALTFDVKLFPLLGPIQPYFAAGVGSYFLTDDGMSLYAEGPGYQVGGGIDFWLGRHVSLGLKAQYRGVGMVNYDRQGTNSYLSLFTGAINVTGRF
jgi:hypothetical protein